MPKSKEPKFKFLDKVKVSSGFYVGMSGFVKDFIENNREYYTHLKSEDGEYLTEWIHESRLEPILKGKKK